MRRLFFFSLVALCARAAPDTISAQTDLYAGWMLMYDLKFDEAHRIFDAWKRNHPADALGPASNAAAYLFSELARLGALESELFVDDARFKERARLRPDPAKKALFTREIADAEHLADIALARSAADETALFARSLTFGLRADNAGLIEKQSLAALSFTKQGRVYADRLIQLNPQAFDAYLRLGVENYLLSLKPAPLRALLWITGSNVDREKGIEQIRNAALHAAIWSPSPGFCWR
jgi:hypothetical protein